MFSPFVHSLGAAEITRGGGMHFEYPGLVTKELGPAIVQCKFINNYALSDGGAVWSDAGQGEIGPRFINCQFIANEADTGNGGAAFMGIGVEDSWVNCLFRDNSAGGDGGAVYEDHVITPTEMVNCTFVRNTANAAGGGGSGGAVHSTDGTVVTLTNCVVWLNTPDQLDLLDNSGATVSYSDVQGGYSGTGNIDADPDFVDPDGPDDMVNTDDDDFRLRGESPSPCIDKGDNATIESATPRHASWAVVRLTSIESHRPIHPLSHLPIRSPPDGAHNFRGA